MSLYVFFFLIEVFITFLYSFPNIKDDARQ